MMPVSTPTIFGAGLASRDSNFIDNAVRRNLLAFLARGESATGRLLHHGAGDSRSGTSRSNELGALPAEQRGGRAHQASTKQEQRARLRCRRQLRVEVEAGRIAYPAHGACALLLNDEGKRVGAIEVQPVQR